MAPAGLDDVPSFVSDEALHHTLDLVKGLHKNVAHPLMPPELEYGPVFTQDLRTGKVLWENGSVDLSKRCSAT